MIMQKNDVIQFYITKINLQKYKSNKVNIIYNQQKINFKQKLYTMSTATICCQQCGKPFLYADSLWFCCSRQKNNNLYSCIKCKQKKCNDCYSTRKHSTSYIIAQNQMQKNNQRKQSRSTNFRKTQNLFQKNSIYNYSSYEEKGFSPAYKEPKQRNYYYQGLKDRFNQNYHIPTNIKVSEFSTHHYHKSPEKKIFSENIYLDKKCEKQYHISQIHEIIYQSKQNALYIKLPSCECLIKKAQLVVWIRDKCLICGKKQKLQSWRTILRNDSYACSKCLQDLQSKVQFHPKPTLQQKKICQYVNSLCYRCLQCQKIIKNTVSMSQQSYLSLNKPDELMLCKQCSFYSKKHQSFVLDKISHQKQKELQQRRKFQLYNFFDKNCHKYYHICYIHQLTSQNKKQRFVQLRCGCKVQTTLLKDWMQEKCLICGKIEKSSYSKYILKNEGNICGSCNYRFNQKDLSESDKQLSIYINSLRYICVQCNHDIVRKENLSESQLEDEQFVLCKHCYESLKYREKLYQQSIQTRQKVNYKEKKEIQMQKKGQSNKQEKQMAKRPRYNAKYQPGLTQKGKCPICEQVRFLNFVQALGMSICISCKGKNSSQSAYEYQQILNKQKYNDQKLKFQCSKCSRLILQNQWICYKSDGKLICKFCSQKQQKQKQFNDQPQMKQKVKQHKSPQKESYMKQKINSKKQIPQEKDFPQQKLIENQSFKNSPQKKQNYSKQIKDKFSSIKQSKIQNIQKKIIIENQNGYHQTHSRHLKEQQINQKGQKKIKQEKYNTQVKKSRLNQSGQRQRSQKSQRKQNLSLSKSNSDLKRSAEKYQSSLKSQKSQKQQKSEKSQMQQRQQKQQKQQKIDKINQKNDIIQQQHQRQRPEESSNINEDSLEVSQFLSKNSKILPDQISIYEMNKISGIKSSDEQRFIDLKNASLSQDQNIENVLQKLNDQSFQAEVIPVNMKKQSNLNIEQQRISERSQKDQTISLNVLEVSQSKQEKSKTDSHFQQVQDSLQVSNLRNKQSRPIQDLKNSNSKLSGPIIKQGNFIKSQPQGQGKKQQQPQHRPKILSQPQHQPQPQPQPHQKIVIRKKIFTKENQIPQHDPLVEKQFAIIQNQEMKIEFQQEDKLQTCMQCGYLTNITQLFVINNQQKVFVVDKESQNQKFQGIKMCKSCYVFQQTVLKQTQFQNSKKKSSSINKNRQMKSIEKGQPSSLKRYTSSQKKKQQKYNNILNETQLPINRKTDYLYKQIGQNVSQGGLDLIRDKLKMGNVKPQNQKGNYSQKYNLTGSAQKKNQMAIKQVNCQLCNRQTNVLFFDKYCIDCFKKV